MVAFRNATRGEPVTDWWDDGADAIAFGRGSKGFVAINHESSTVERTYQTSLPAGTYCDVQSNTMVTVDSAGRFTAALGPDTALALYAGKPSC
jgi:alpha-amylase